MSPIPTADYFDELLRKVKEIRASERRVYQKINEIYKECSYDYESDSDVTRTFYATMQNKIHWAITGKTAAELILDRANCDEDNMGLSTWEKSPEGNIRQADVFVAKNYYKPDEIDHLHSVVNMYLDYAERQAELHTVMYMENWASKLDEFLEFNEYEVLHCPKVSMHSAKEHALGEYEKYKVSS